VVGGQWLEVSGGRSMVGGEWWEVSGGRSGIEGEFQEREVSGGKLSTGGQR